MGKVKVMKEGNIEGRNGVLEALRSGHPLHKIFLARGTKPGFIAQIRRLAREQGVIIQEVERSRLDQIAVTGKHQGVIAQAMARAYVQPEEILAIARQRGEDPFVLLL